MSKEPHAENFIDRYIFIAFGRAAVLQINQRHVFWKKQSENGRVEVINEYGIGQVF